MKIRSAAASASAAALALVFALGTAGCGKKDDNANNTNGARNANATNANGSSGSTAPAASEDTAIRNKTEAALAKAGLSGVTVEVDGGAVTLKGTLPKAKWQDAMKAANESGAKKVNNQLNEK